MTLMEARVLADRLLDQGRRMGLPPHGGEDLPGEDSRPPFTPTAWWQVRFRHADLMLADTGRGLSWMVQIAALAGSVLEMCQS